MPETKSTPGPWQKITSRLQMLILARMERKSCAGTSYDVCEVTDEEIIEVIEKNLDTKYAAAPDMLEALEWLVADYKERGEECWCLEGVPACLVCKAESAISKAKGEADV